MKSVHRMLELVEKNVVIIWARRFMSGSGSVITKNRDFISATFTSLPALIVITKQSIFI